MLQETYYQLISQYTNNNPLIHQCWSEIEEHYTSDQRHYHSLHHLHNLLNELMGTRLAPILFAVALIAAGQSSTVTGTLAGQIVMEGYLSLRINPWVRRLMTRLIAIIPAVIVILVNGEDNIDDLLIFSQQRL